MNSFLDAIAVKISSSASLFYEILDEAVTIALMALNQLFSRRQKRLQFLQPKIEELYQHLNDVAERNTRLFKLLLAVINGDLKAKENLDGLDELELCGHINAKKMIMLIRLYFPDLTRIHQYLFAAERQLGEQIWALSTNTPPTLEALIETSGKLGHMIRLMEQEMVTNQHRLLRSKLFSNAYRQATQLEIENVPPPPEKVQLSKS